MKCVLFKYDTLYSLVFFYYDNYENEILFGDTYDSYYFTLAYFLKLFTLSLFFIIYKLCVK